MTEPGATRRRPSPPGSPTSIARMTLEEKVAQLSGVWGVDPDVGEMAPMLARALGPLQTWDDAIADGLGQLTRPFGTGAGRAAPRAARPGGAAAGGDGGQPVRHPGPGARGVPHRAGRLARHDLPVAAVLGRVLRPRPRRADGRAHRRRPCARLGIHQGLAPVLDVVRDLRWGRVEETHGRGPVPRRPDRQRLRARPGEQRRGGDAQALPRLLRLAGRPQPRTGVDGSARARRRDPAAVRDGAAGGRPVGDELLHRHRRRPGRGRPGLLTDAAARQPRLHRDRGRRLLLRRVPADAPPRGREPRRGGRRWRSRPASTSSCRRSNAFGEPLLAAVADGDRRREARRPRARPRAAAEVRARPARPGLGARRAGRRRPRRRRVAGARARARPAVGRAAGERRHPAAAPGRQGRRRRPARRHLRGDAGLLLLPHARARALPRRRARRWRSARSARRSPTTYDVTYALGCPVLGGSDDDIAAAAATAAAADVCVAVLGDQAGLFGNGTSGEGCDVADLRLPGRQEELLEALLGDRHSRRRGPARRAPLRPEPAGRPAGRRSCAASSRARRARRRSPTCSPAG